MEDDHVVVEMWKADLFGCADCLKWNVDDWAMQSAVVGKIYWCEAMHYTGGLHFPRICVRVENRANKNEI